MKKTLLTLTCIAVATPALALFGDSNQCENENIANQLKYKYCYQDKVQAEGQLENIQNQYSTEKSRWEKTQSGLTRDLAAANQTIEELTAEKAQTEKKLLENNEQLAKAYEILKEKSGEREQKLAQENQKLRDLFQKETTQLQELLSQARSQWAKEKKDLSMDFEGKLAKSEQDKFAFAAELDRLKKLSKDQQMELDRLKAQEDQLSEQLKAEIEKGQIRLKKFHSKLIINVDNQITFDSGSADLKPQVLSTFDKIAAILAEYPENRVMIEGHTDNIPLKSSIHKDNWGLSTQRALAVLRHLLKNAKLDPSRMAAVGYGEQQPIVPNDSEENRALNRRVDIVVIPRVQ